MQVRWTPCERGLGSGARHIFPLPLPMRSRHYEPECEAECDGNPDCPFRIRLMPPFMRQIAAQKGSDEARPGRRDEWA
jgi:hypothetical protein